MRLRGSNAGKILSLYSIPNLLPSSNLVEAFLQLT
jgi:hypothetical protein